MPDAGWGYLLAASALVLFAGGILLTKVASSRIDLSLGFLIATSVNVVFSAVVLGIQLAWRQKGLAWNPTAFALFAFAGVFATYLGRWFFYEAVVRFGPAKASIFQVSSPLFTALIAWLWLGERLTLGAVAGMVLTVAGLILVSYKPSPAPALPVVHGDAVVPVAPVASWYAAWQSSLARRLFQSVLILGMSSSLAYAIGNVLRGSGIRLWNEPVLGGLAGASVGLAMHLLFSSGKRQLLGRLGAANRGGAALYALIGVTTISGQMCGIAAMRYIPFGIATLITLCTPLLVFPLRYLFFRNRDDLSAVTLVGSAMALLGIFIIVLR